MTSCLFGMASTPLLSCTPKSQLSANGIGAANDDDGRMQVGIFDNQSSSETEDRPLLVVMGWSPAGISVAVACTVECMAMQCIRWMAKLPAGSSFRSGGACVVVVVVVSVVL